MLVAIFLILVFKYTEQCKLNDIMLLEYRPQRHYVDNYTIHSPVEKGATLIFNEIKDPCKE